MGGRWQAARLEALESRVLLSTFTVTSLADDGSSEGTLYGDRVAAWGSTLSRAFRPNPHEFMSNTLRLMRGAVAAQANG